MFFDKASSGWNRAASAVVGALGRGARTSRRRPRRRGDRGLLRTDHLIEWLEDRRLLDAGGTVFPTDNFGVVPLASPSPLSNAFTPAQIRKAYGIDLLLAAGNQGQGQTVAIVDEYDWQTATTDLAKFSAQFGLPQMDGVHGDPTFTKVNSNGTQAPSLLRTPQVQPARGGSRKPPMWNGSTRSRPWPTSSSSKRMRPTAGLAKCLYRRGATRRVGGFDELGGG